MMILSTMLLTLLFILFLCAEEGTKEARTGKYVSLILTGVPLAYLITQLFR
jgi:hypothetical protein